MLNKEILDILDQLRKDLPDFNSLQCLSPHLATSIAYWIDEDRNHFLRQKKVASKGMKKYKQTLGKLGNK